MGRWFVNESRIVLLDIIESITDPNALFVGEINKQNRIEYISRNFSNTFQVTLFEVPVTLLYFFRPKVTFMCETEAEGVLNTQQHILDGRPIRVNAAFEDGDKTPYYKYVPDHINVLT